MFITYFNCPTNRNEIPYPLTWDGLVARSLQTPEIAEFDTVPMGVEVHLPKPSNILTTFALVTNQHPTSDGGELAYIGGTFYWVERTTPTWLECSLWGAATLLCNPSNEVAWSRCTPIKDYFPYIQNDAMLSYTRAVAHKRTIDPVLLEEAGIVITLVKDPAETATQKNALWNDARAAMKAFTSCPVSWYIANLDTSSGSPVPTPRIGSQVQETLQNFCAGVAAAGDWDFVTRIQVIPNRILQNAETRTIMTRHGANLVEIVSLNPTNVSYLGITDPVPGYEFPPVLRKQTVVRVENYNTNVLEFELANYNQASLEILGSVENGLNLYIRVSESPTVGVDAVAPNEYATVTTPDIIAYGDSFTAWYRQNQESFTNQQLVNGTSMIVGAVGLIASVASAPLNPALAVAGVVASSASLLSSGLSARETHNQQQQAIANARKGVSTMGVSGKGYQCDAETDWIRVSYVYPCAEDREWNTNIVRRYGTACTSFGGVDLAGFRYRAYQGTVARVIRHYSLTVTQAELIDRANAELMSGVVFYTVNPYTLYTTAPYAE